MNRVLQAHLEPMARDDRRRQLWRDWMRCWLIAAGVAVVFVLVRHFAGWSPAWLPVLLGAGVLAATLLIRMRHRRRAADYRALARKIEKENPELHALLLTAVEQQPDPSGHFGYLQECVIREALMQDCAVQWQERTRARLKLARVAGIAALLILAVCLMPGRQPSPARVVGAHIEVTPGDISLEKGSSLVVLAKFARAVPAEVVLVARPANEPERRIPLMKNLDDPVFGGSISEVAADLTYRIEYGEATTPEFKVSVYEHPRLERADARITFPKYTGIPEKTVNDTRRISAVEGSRLDYTFHLNKPVRSASLVAKDKPAVVLAPDANRPNVLVAQFDLDENLRYELRLVDEAGRTNKLPPRLVIDVLRNQPPVLKFAFPKGDQRVSALQEIAFTGEATDDFGLKAYGIAYNLAGAEVTTIELGRDADAHEKRPFAHLLALEDLGAEPDQLLSYYLWAEDTGPDGELRRTMSDMFFAEVRPFEEIFREGQGGDDGSPQQQQQERGGEAARLAEMQKQIISATWNIQRREMGARSQTGKAGTRTPPPPARAEEQPEGRTPNPERAEAPRPESSPVARGYKADVVTVKESQEDALSQVETQRSRAEDPQAVALLDQVRQQMEKAVTELARAAEDHSLKPLAPALAAEQLAYQALLRLAEREYQISRGGNQRGQGGRSASAQRQLDQLDLRQSENRYETQRLASPPQTQEQREQLQAFSRLKELAQRQQDVNERLKELQAALQEARTEQEREEIRRNLKRLREEQQQMLADVDELRQRMDRPENQSRMAEARQQLDQTRSEVQRAAEAMEQGATSEAIASGTRAQRELQQLRDDFRRQSSSQFAEEMRDLRERAQELSQRQEEIGRELDALDDPGKRRALTDSDERRQLAQQLDEQTQRLNELVDQAGEVTRRAEPVEPLLSRQLYDMLRQAAQDDVRNRQETMDDLLTQGRLYRGVYERLSRRDDSKRAVEVAAELLRDGFASEAGQLEERARRSINEMRRSVERAAESVLGDETEALRLARRELDELTGQLEREIADRTAASDDQSPAPPSDGGAGRGEEERRSDSSQDTAAASERGTPARRASAGENESDSESRGSGRGGRQEVASTEPQPGRGEPSGESPRSGDSSARGGGGNPRGPRNFFDQFDEGGGGGTTGPMTGPDYARWSDRLRDVEEMLDTPELRAEAARIRDRARLMRGDFQRHSEEPQWDLVRLELAVPLVELRARVSQELARRESPDALAPIDRDPVPARYSDLVRRYYERLGTGESRETPSSR